MNWHQKAEIACKEKDLKVLEFEGGYVFVKDKEGKIYPIREDIIATWIN